MVASNRALTFEESVTKGKCCTYIVTAAMRAPVLIGILHPE